MTTISERIKEIRLELKLSQSQLGKSSVSQWENGTTKNLLGKNLVQICKGTGINPYWLETGRGEKYAKNIKSSEKFTMKLLTNSHILEPVNTYTKETPLHDDDVELFLLIETDDGGGNRTIKEGEPMRFPKVMLETAKVQPENAFLIHIKDNSMAPVLRKGSFAGINFASTDIIDGKMYAIDHYGEIRVKNLYKLPGGGLRLNNFNSEYPDEIYKQDETKNIKILGGIFWYAFLFTDN